MSGVALSTTPSSQLTRMEPALFRVLLQRRLALPLPLSNRTCRCGRPLDAFGHHRAACARCGVLGSRGFALESAAGRVCREAGARVATNQFVRDLDLGVPNANDNRRLAGSNWPWTQLSFPQFGGMANQCLAQQTGMAWH